MKKILVYPCGTEIGLEIYRALSKSPHFEIFGGSSNYDHGRFVYKRHIDGLPFINDDSNEKDIVKFNEQIRKYSFDFIYPAMDGVLTKFSKYKELFDAEIMAPDYETSMITRSKKKTYELFRGKLPIPIVYDNADEVERFPVFIKPDVGQGSCGTYKINSKKELNDIKVNNESQLLLEYLPGKEYTIDCFTNMEGRLVYCQGRERKRIKNGISVNACLCNNDCFFEFAQIINNTLRQRGGWFFQLKEDNDGNLKLLEIASRIAGTSAIQRCIGANLPLLTANIYAGIKIDDVVINNHYIELDRALQNNYRIDLQYDTVYVDYDDTVIIDNKVNTELISFLYQCINKRKEIILLSKHDGNLHKELEKFRIKEIFDRVIHIKREECKASYIKGNSIFIDDSYGERKDVSKKCEIPVFDVAMIECLMEEC